MKILIVDDDEENCKTLESMLKEKKFDVIIAHDGAEGLHLVKMEKPDYIVTDMNMPFMDGFELTHKVRAIGDKTPLILYTSKEAGYMKEIAGRSGVTEFLSNSNVKIIFETVRDRLSRAFDENTTAMSKLNPNT
jgi:CheY-like chemotaxis protein